MKYLFIFSVLFISLTTTPSTAQTTPAIQGNWEWLRTEHTGEETETPETVGYTVQMEFRSDYSYFEYEDGVVVREDTWRGGMYITCIGR